MRRGLVKLTPTWVSWERAATFVMDAIMSFELHLGSF